MKFLVVDDNAVDRRFLASLIEDLGHQADVCGSADEALAQVMKAKYDSVILDVVMPEQDGYKFLRTLRANQTTAQQYVILCSSKKTPLEIDYGIKRAGANDYLTKPASKESLAQALKKIGA